MLSGQALLVIPSLPFLLAPNFHFNYPRPAPISPCSSVGAATVMTWSVSEVVGSNHTGVTDFFSFSVWSQFLSWVIAWKEQLGIFVQHCLQRIIFISLPLFISAGGPKLNDYQWLWCTNYCGGFEDCVNWTQVQTNLLKIASSFFLAIFYLFSSDWNASCAVYVKDCGHVYKLTIAWSHHKKESLLKRLHINTRTTKQPRNNILS